MVTVPNLSISEIPKTKLQLLAIKIIMFLRNLFKFKAIIIPVAVARARVTRNQASLSMILMKLSERAIELSKPSRMCVQQ